MSRFRIQSLQAVSDALSVKRLDQHITVLPRALYAAYRFQQELSINHGTEKKARKEKKNRKDKRKRWRVQARCKKNWDQAIIAATSSTTSHFLYQRISSPRSMLPILQL